MTFQTSILLPSQESLLHRLQHVVLYGQQLTVLTGDAGAGKTTITTALVDQLEDVSSALVVCPLHADSAEIRRKILVQLLSEPVFDDEVPLPETILRLADALPSHCHVVLDDAHHLPLELWAECIVLSQLGLTGKSLSLTLTAPVDYLNQILLQLPEQQRPSILPLSISPLSLEEREGLYYTLLHRSEETPFTPRDIVKDQLLRQQGTPAEVVNLLYLALHGEAPETKQGPWYLYTAFGFGGLILLLLAYWMLNQDTEAPLSSKVETVSAVRAAEHNFGYAQTVLADYFNARTLRLTGNAIEVGQPKTKSDVSDANVEPAAKPHQAEVTETLSLDVEESAETAHTSALGVVDAVEAASETLTSTAQQAVEVETFAVEGLASPKEVHLNDEANNAKSSGQPTGYTLQLATVTKRESLDDIIMRLPDSQAVQIARYKEYWVLLYGQYQDLQQAKSAAQLLSQDVGISSAWARAWADLSGYRLQQGLAGREIQ